MAGSNHRRTALIAVTLATCLTFVAPFAAYFFSGARVLHAVLWPVYLLGRLMPGPCWDPGLGRPLFCEGQVLGGFRAAAALAASFLSWQLALSYVVIALRAGWKKKTALERRCAGSSFA